MGVSKPIIHENDPQSFKVTSRARIKLSLESIVFPDFKMQGTSYSVRANDLVEWIQKPLICS